VPTRGLAAALALARGPAAVPMDEAGRRPDAAVTEAPMHGSAPAVAPAALPPAVAAAHPVTGVGCGARGVASAGRWTSGRAGSLGLDGSGSFAVVNSGQTSIAPSRNISEVPASGCFQEFLMSGTAAYKNPFADFDFSKIFGSFKIPSFDMANAVESSHKNFAAMTAMNAAAFDSITSITRRQAEMMQTAIEGFSRHGGEMLSNTSMEEKLAKQIDFAKRGYEAAIADSKELVDLCVKSQAVALATVRDRIAALSDEITTAIAKK
jgi:phasin family protein